MQTAPPYNPDMENQERVGRRELFGLMVSGLATAAAACVRPGQPRRCSTHRMVASSDGSGGHDGAGEQRSK